jgi:sporulation protein YlmC with PRC-barrel domain
MLKLTSSVLLAGLLASPVLAQAKTTQTQQPAPGMNAPAATNGTNITAGSVALPLPRNPIMTDHGGLRASKIIGTPVYNDNGQKIGTIDDLVIGLNNDLHAVISVGGFLDTGNKMVALPFDQLQFGTTTATPEARVIAPGVTREVLNNLPPFHYLDRG